jgi:ferredoxin, 2Fe-2S
MADNVKIVFIDRAGTRKELSAAAGVSLMQVAKSSGIDMEGACEGCMACSTCHVIVDKEWFGKLPKAAEAEADMLDLTYGVLPTSRLSCQITLSASIDGLVVRLPQTTRNMMD